jgi:formylglycine-generating enzyme required for sulfatase activity
MVDVAGRFCIDRFEAALYERGTERRVSPHYHPSPELALRDYKDWKERAPRIGPISARKMPLPELPAWQTDRDFEIMARSERGQIPNAYLDLKSARSACSGSGKRLCTRDEWLTACRSDRATRHPYGEKFEPLRCNIERVHPASTLHGRDVLGELDPRMNLVERDGSRLLFPTGNMPDCASRWEDDRIYDMVGNLDEWIEDASGVFLGGFYARETRHGCDARIDLHSPDYYDYSLGTRCCR